MRHRELAAWLLSLLAVLHGADSAPAAERVLLGYYADFGKMPVEQIPWERLTHVGHAFLRVDAGGEPVTTDAMPNLALTADGRQNDVPVLVTIGGGQTAGGLEKATATSDSTRALVKKVLRVVADGRYDGVDVDWEFPRDAATRAGQARLLLDLRRGLDALARREKRATPYLLTAAVSPQPFFGQWVDVERVAPAVDWFNVMAYDMSGAWSRVAAHPAPLFAADDDPERRWRSVAGAMGYWRGRGVPAEKLVVGAPMFGRSMPAARPHEPLDPELADRHRALPFSVVRKRVGEGWLAEWDNQCRAPWLRKPPAQSAASSPLALDDDPPVLIGYDDRNSIHEKATWARGEGYRGLFFWAVHQDRMPDGRHWLLEAANKAWPAE